MLKKPPQISDTIQSMSLLVWNGVFEDVQHTGAGTVPGLRFKLSTVTDH